MKLVSPADTTDDGLEGMYITLTDNFSGDVYSTTTDLEGRFGLVTSVKDNNPPAPSNTSNLSALVYGDNSGARFLHNGKNSEIRIFNLIGQEVARFTGNYWDLRNRNGSKISSGYYKYTIDDENFILSGSFVYDGKNISRHPQVSGENLQRDVTELNKDGISNSLTTQRYTLAVRDELGSEIGEFNDIIDEADNLEDFIGTSMNYNGTAVRNLYEMMPHFEIDHPYDANFVEFVMNNTGHAPNSNNDEISLTQLQESFPRKLFRNTSTAPTETFNQASLDLMNNIQDSSAIEYRGHVTPGISITEVMQFDSSGYNLDYSEPTSRTVPFYLPDPDGDGGLAGC